MLLFYVESTRRVAEDDLHCCQVRQTYFLLTNFGSDLILPTVPISAYISHINFHPFKKIKIPCLLLKKESYQMLIQKENKGCELKKAT